MNYASLPLRYQLNLQQFAGEKTEEATPKRRQDARKKGQVAKSQELPAALILMSSFLVFYWFSDYFYGHIKQLFVGCFQEFFLMDATMSNLNTIFMQVLYHSAILIAPILGTTFVIGILANYMQIGFLFTGEPLIPSFGKLNPLNGLKKMFSLRSLVELMKSLIKLIVVGYVAFSSVWNEKLNLLQLAQLPVAGMLGYVANLTFWIVFKIAALLLILAFFDFIYQRYELNKELKMSKDDIKQEYKNAEGDPQVKAKIREIQRRIAMRRMMQEVPKADVIITNPTHYAVALKYDAGMSAPIVLAKGVDFVALKIREVAAQHGIMLMENKPLARAIYNQVEIGDSIPPELFQAVAEVLAYVIKLKRNII